MPPAAATENAVDRRAARGYHGLTLWSRGPNRYIRSRSRSGISVGEERTGSLLYFRSPANLDQISSGSGLPRAVLARVVVGLQCFITHWPVGEFFVPAE